MLVMITSKMVEHGAGHGTCGKRTLLDYFRTSIGHVAENGAATDIRPRSSLDTVTGCMCSPHPSEMDETVTTQALNLHLESRCRLDYIDIVDLHHTVT